MHTRRVKRIRLVPHTVNGETRMVKDRYEEYIPVPPRDWDRILLAGASVIAAAALIASVVWSTASVGALLARAVPAAAAYAAAGTFDAAWIVCLVIEWLARFDSERARLPMWSGHVALLVAMGAVAANGALNGGLPVALVGAAVSALAKGMWTVVLRHHAPPLDERTKQWVAQRAAEVGGQLALAANARQLVRSEGQLAAYRAAYGLPAGQPSATGPDRPDPRPGMSGPVRAAIRAALATMPDASAEEIATQLSGARIQVTAEDVRTTAAELDDEDDDQVRDDDVPHLPPPGSPRVSDLVRQLLKSGDPGESAVVAAVLKARPDAKTDSIARVYRRHRPKKTG